VPSAKSRPWVCKSWETDLAAIEVLNLAIALVNFSTEASSLALTAALSLAWVCDNFSSSTETAEASFSVRASWVGAALR
jgi:hypothetical protein